MSSLVGAQYLTDEGELLGLAVSVDTFALMGFVAEPLLPWRPKGTRSRKVVFSRLRDGHEVVLPSSLPWSFSPGDTVVIGGDNYVVTRQHDETGVFER
jgi:hypothetical protein